MDGSFLELVGIVIGDGNLWSDGRHRRVEVTGDAVTDMEYFSHISKSMSLFTDRRISIIRKKNFIRIRVCSKEFYNRFLDFGLKSGRDKMHGLRFLDRLKSGDRVPVIRGLMDTDGSVVRRSNGQVFMQISTSSRFLANWINASLRDMGFRCFVASRRNRKYSRTEYNVWLSGRRNMRRWLHVVGFSNKYKLDKSLNILSDGVVAQPGSDPEGSLKAFR